MNTPTPMLLDIGQWEVPADINEASDFQRWQVERFHKQTDQLLSSIEEASAYGYLIQFRRLLGSSKHSAQFYLGVSANLKRRMHEHCYRRERGSNIVYVAVQRHIPCDVICIFPFTQSKDAFAWESYRKKSVKTSHASLLTSFQSLDQ